SESTLDCFGDFEDVRCAAETELACATWNAFLYDKSLEKEFGPPREALSFCTQVEEREYPSGLAFYNWETDLYAKFLFRLSDPWILEEDDIPRWTKGYSKRAAPIAGDTAFDVEAFMCGPLLPARSPIRCISSGMEEDCAVDTCKAYPKAPETYRVPPMGEFRFPFAVVVMRQDAGRWRLVNILLTGYADRDGEGRWRPPRFRVGPVVE
ncbi:MAG: hypothetical protein WD489_10405, partial [Rhodovibrionaceae bacterium]